MNPEWMNDPEAFSADYEEMQALFADLHDEFEQDIVEGDLCDIVREHEEEEGEALDPTRDYAGEWDEFWSRFDFPFEGGE